MSSAGKHHEISKIGEEILKKAIAEANPGKEFNLQSFYLGNWLTDFSQAIDPVAFNSIQNEITQALNFGISTVVDIESTAKNVALEGLETLQDGVKTLRKSKSGLKMVDDILEKIYIEMGSRLASTEDIVQTLKLSEAFINVATEVNGDVSSFVSAGTTSASSLIDNKESSKYSELEWAVRSTVITLGYAKFVMSNDGKGKKMDDDIYLQIMDRNLTQYFPHEHIDRPDAFKYRINGQDNYVTRVANAPLSKNSQIKEKKGHLYQYLRDDIHILAGKLTQIDDNWGQHTFDFNKKQFIGMDNEVYEIENSKEWDFYLADLGHVLHGVEDYFAHSNFIEHASMLKKDAFEKYRLMESQNSKIYTKRLLKWSGPKEEGDKEAIEKFMPEPNVATGYFDFIDTFHSLSHIVESLFNWPHELLFDKVQNTADTASKVEDNYKQFFTDSVELLTLKNEKTLDEFIEKEQLKPKGKKNKALEYLLNTDTVKDWKIVITMGKDDKELEKRTKKIKPIADFLAKNYYGQYNDVPKEVKDNYTDAIVLWTRYKAGVSLYQSLKTLISFLSNPLKWLKKKLPEFLGEKTKELLMAYAASYFHEWTGAQRIGCHSLMAKDVGDELFHKPSFQCAQSVHWYIMHQLTTNPQQRVFKIKSSSLDSSNFNKLSVSREIDWLELLEYFMSHPSSFVSETKTVEKNYLTNERFIIDAQKKPSTLGELAKKYNSYYVEKKNNKGEHIIEKKTLTWEIIARHNFPILKVENLLSKREWAKASDALRAKSKLGLEKEINRILLLNNIGYPVKDNMAFHTGTVILIPGQQKTINVTEAISDKELNDNWWYQVTTSKRSWEIFKDWSLKQKLTKNKLGELMPAHRHTPVKVSKEYSSNLIVKANKLKEDKEFSYNSLKENVELIGK
ncbi:HET-C-related protein [sulfur-oxidizing endosymbiont of Gigantopelta aegis]|uniref:HET-C-related protein n=1 Tax=sulfur-oxidizing endosymbiont of Gigantopelta aegis TaxID=2794934 RepID=UPI0018DAFF21|nr:HET-C-related protein [sulfur-oxidizing endosymbiont of Gigantopelta aegis]